jgi:hypothetical protein
MDGDEILYRDLSKDSNSYIFLESYFQGREATVCNVLYWRI